MTLEETGPLPFPGGGPKKPRYERTPLQRLAEKLVLTESGCWEFTGTKNLGGYGHIKVGERLWTTHRLAYQCYVGEIPDGLELDHLCRNRACCNPGHLEPVDHAENARRGLNGRAMRWVRQTHCRNGHPYDLANTYMTPEGHRACRVCVNEASHRYRARKKAA